jgi:hypothetical protein
MPVCTFCLCDPCKCEFKRPEPAPMTIELAAGDRRALVWALDILRDSSIADWVTSAPNPVDTRAQAIVVVEKILAAMPGEL